LAITFRKRSPAVVIYWRRLEARHHHASAKQKFAPRFGVFRRATIKCERPLQPDAVWVQGLEPKDE